jgi:hypothetical protein
VFLIALLTEIDDFFNALIFGAGSWFYLALFLGILFLVAWKINLFGVVAFILSLFSMIAFIEYGNTNGWTNDLVYRVLALGFSMIIFLYLFAGAIKEG